MQKLFKLLFLIIFTLSIFFASWYVLHGDIYFGADQARDFHILRELDKKKIILIGPRASGELFHGIGWPYLNYPFFLIGKGDPVAVGWGWVVFTGIAGLIAYYVGKKLFDAKTGYLFGTMMVLYAAFHARGMINPDGVMIVLPLFFYSFVRYFQTFKPKYLFLNILVGGLMVQTELMAIPLAFISFVAFFVKIVKEKKFAHSFLFLIFPVLLSNFLVFDLRHNFLISKKFFDFVTPQRGPIYSFPIFIANRIDFAFGGTEFLRRNIASVNLILFLLTLTFIFIQVRNCKYKLIYFSFLYFYFGYYILSLLNKGQVLYFHEYPIFPLVFLVFSSFIVSKYSKVFLILFSVILILNLQSAYLDIKDAGNFIGKDRYSWKFLNQASGKIFKSSDNEFGIFVYAPDILAYEPKYAVLYNAEKSGKKSYYFQKKPITYLFIQPPPENNPYMKDEWWVKNQVKISSKPVLIIKFDNGYKIEKYFLSESGIKIPFDPNINPGLIFR